MPSIAGETVLDPFTGIGSTNIAAVAAGRHSIDNELEKNDFDLVGTRVGKAAARPMLFGPTQAVVTRIEATGEGENGMNTGSSKPSSGRSGVGLANRGV
jgi:hypothetical protein